MAIDEQTRFIWTRIIFLYFFSFFFFFLLIGEINHLGRGCAGSVQPVGAGFFVCGRSAGLYRIRTACATIDTHSTLARGFEILDFIFKKQ